MKAVVPILLLLLLPFRLTAQESSVPGDNVLRFYRLAIPVANSAFEEDFGSNYDSVIEFWQECEDFVNRVFVPAGFCFEVITDESLVMHERNLIDESIYNAPSFGTELLDGIIGSDAYDIAMWVAYRPDNSENTGLSVQHGAYSHSAKGSGYAMPDTWVVAHEIGHLLGAGHTVPGEGSLMDNIGDFLSYPSLKEIRVACMERNGAYYSDEQRTQLVGNDAGGNYVYGIKVVNSAPGFLSNKMHGSYRIPQGSCLAVGLYATDDNDDTLRYMSMGNDVESLASLPPQSSHIIDYRPRYSADMFYPEYFYSVTGTDIPTLYPGTYGISLLVYDCPEEYTLEAMKRSPFYCNYAVWDAEVQVVGGTPFAASLSPAKESYAAGECVEVKWGVNNGFFSSDSRLCISMSANYGASFDYVLAESVPARDGSCVVELPNVNVGNVDVDFISAVRSMPGGVIRIEEIGGVAYTLTALSPEQGGSFNVVGGVDTGIDGLLDKSNDESARSNEIYDLQGRRVFIEGANNLVPGIYIVNGKKVVVR